jgi:hypothetical protein
MSKSVVVELTEHQLDTVSGGSGPRAFEIKDWSFGTTNSTSATGGAGAVSITKTKDQASPNLF